MEGSTKSKIRTFILEHFTQSKKGLKRDALKCEKFLRAYSLFNIDNFDYNLDHSGEMLLASLELYYEFLHQYIELKQMEMLKPEEFTAAMKEQKSVYNFQYKGAQNLVKVIYLNGVNYFEEEVQIEILTKAKQVMLSKITNLLAFNYQPVLLSNFFVEYPDLGEDEYESLGSDQDGSSLSEKDLEEEEEKGASKSKKEGNDEKEVKQEEEKEGKPINNLFDIPPKAFLTTNPEAYIKNTILADFEDTGLTFPQKVEKFMALTFLSQQMFFHNKYTEPGYKATVNLLEDLLKLLEYSLSILFGLPFDSQLYNLPQPPKNDDQIPPNEGFQSTKRFYYIFLVKGLGYLLHDFLMNHIQDDKKNPFEPEKQDQMRNFGQRVNKVALSMIIELQKYSALSFEIRQLRLMSYLLLGNACLFNINLKCSEPAVIQQSYQEIANVFLQLVQPFSESPANFKKNEKIIIRDVGQLIAIILEQDKEGNLAVFFSQPFTQALITLFHLDQEQRALIENDPSQLFDQQVSIYSDHYKQQLLAVVNNLAGQFEESSQKFLTSIVVRYKTAISSQKLDDASACLSILAACTNATEASSKKQIKQFLTNDIIPIVKSNEADLYLRTIAIRTVQQHLKSLGDEVEQDTAQYLYMLGTSPQTHSLVKSQAMFSTTLDILEVIDHVTAKGDYGPELFALYQHCRQHVLLYPTINEYVYGIYDLMLEQREALIKQSPSFLVECVQTLCNNILLMTMREEIFEANDNIDEDDRNEYYKNVCETVNMCLVSALSCCKFPEAWMENAEELQKSFKTQLKEIFKKVCLPFLDLVQKRMITVLLSFFLFLNNTKTQFATAQEEESKNDDEYKPMSDYELVRYLILNSLFSYNSEEKVTHYLENKNNSKEKKDVQDGDQFLDSTNYQKVDQVAFIVSFALSQLKDNPLSIVLESSSLDNDDYANVKYWLYQLLKIYTKMIQDVQVLNLSNHISYWLIVSQLIETCQLEDLDQEYLEQNDNQPPESFFILEESLKLLPQYFRKLADWYNSAIFIFYFQLINLYYWYDTERTYSHLMEAFEGKPGSQLIYTKEVVLPEPDCKELHLTMFIDPEVRNYLISTKGALWTVLGIKGLLSFDKTKEEAKQFVANNLKALSKMVEIVLSFYLPSNEQTKDFLSEAKLMQGSAPLVNEKNLLADLNMDPLDPEDETDEVLLPFYRYYYVSFQSLIQFDEVRADIKLVVEHILESLESSTQVTVDERVALKDKANLFLVLVEEGGEEQKEESEDDDD